MSRLAVELKQCGDSAILALARHGRDEDRWQLVHDLGAAVQRTELPGLRDAIATYDSVLVEFDHLRIDPSAVERIVRSVAQALLSDGQTSTATGRTFWVPVLYGSTCGPDLDDVAQQLDVTTADVIAWHQSATFTVRCRGRGGGPMLHNSAWPTPIRRLPVPRVANPAGSIAVAGTQATIQGVTGPGGWRIIGRTPLRVVDLTAEPPWTLDPGDRLRFTAIEPSDWDHLADRALGCQDEC